MDFLIVSGQRGAHVSPHLLCSVGVKHLVFEKKPQSFPVPLAGLAALQSATYCPFLTYNHLQNIKTGGGLCFEQRKEPLNNCECGMYLVKGERASAMFPDVGRMNILKHG